MGLVKGFELVGYWSAGARYMRKVKPMFEQCNTLSFYSHRALRHRVIDCEQSRRPL